MESSGYSTESGGEGGSTEMGTLTNEDPNLVRAFPSLSFPMTVPLVTLLTPLKMLHLLENYKFFEN